MKFNLNLEDIKYTKILYQDLDGTPCTTKAAIKSVDERELIACAKFENSVNIKSPQEVTLSLVCKDGLYRTKTKLKSSYEHGEYIFFALETPQGLEYTQNREFFRVPVEYDCVYTVFSDNKKYAYKTHTCDISANGVSIFMTEHKITDKDSTLEITFDGIDIATKVKYIRSEKVENGYKLSFAFSAITNTDRDFISQICIRKQLEQKRNSIK